MHLTDPFDLYLCHLRVGEALTDSVQGPFKAAPISEPKSRPKQGLVYLDLCEEH